MNRARLTLVLIGVLSLALPACGKSSPDDSNASAGAKATFVLDEYSITQPPAALAAGKIRITASNEGHETHELVIVRADDATSLPKKADGSVDEDKIPDADKPGEIPDVAAGKSVTKTIDLTAGSYVAICNLVETTGMGHGGMGANGMPDSAGMGHVHFPLGMVTTFTVV